MHRGADGEVVIASVLFHQAHSSGPFLSKIAHGVRGLQLVEGLDRDGKLPATIPLPPLNFLGFAREVLMAVQPPLTQTGKLLHQDHSKHPTDTYSRLSEYSKADADLPNYRNYYSYKGSLSRPPCTEGVKWVVFKHPLGASEEDIAAMTTLQGTGGNARPAQPLNERLVHSTDVSPVKRA